MTSSSGNDPGSGTAVSSGMIGASGIMIPCEYTVYPSSVRYCHNVVLIHMTPPLPPQKLWEKLNLKSLWERGVNLFAIARILCPGNDVLVIGNKEIQSVINKSKKSTVFHIPIRIRSDYPVDVIRELLERELQKRFAKNGIRI